MNTAWTRAIPDKPPPGRRATDDDGETAQEAQEAAREWQEADAHADADEEAAPGEQAVRAGAVSNWDEAQLADWIERVTDRDERALSALYDATWSRVHGLVLRIVRKAALAEEVVEEAYFQVWRQAVRFDAQRGRASAWLMGMARSRAIDALRHEARHRHESLEPTQDLPDTADDAQAGADELLATARDHAELHRALLRLQPQPRQLVALAFFRGLSHEEIASQTELPLGTVKSQIRRALITLREVLGETGTPALAC